MIAANHRLMDTNMNVTEMEARMREIAATEGELTADLAAEAQELRTAHEALITATQSEVDATAGADTTEVNETRASNSVFIQTSNKMSNFNNNLLGEAIARMGNKTVGQTGDNVDAFLQESRSNFNGTSFTMDFSLASDYMSEQRDVIGIDTVSAGVTTAGGNAVPFRVAPTNDYVR